MNEKLQQLLHKLNSEREEFLGGMHIASDEARHEWQHAESRWENLQWRLRNSGLALAEKVGTLIEEFEEELRELKDDAAAVTWKLNLKTKAELHDLGEDMDNLQHKVADKVTDVRLEVQEEVHELGEELADLYQKIRRHFK